MFVLLVHAAATLAMVGLIWFVQVVHYPLFNAVGDAEFSAYEKSHQSRTTIVVAPLMLAEAATAVWLLWSRPLGVAMWTAVVGAVLLGLIWASTAAWQMPAHARLEPQFDPSVHRWLVSSNWLRTVAWSARGAIACEMLRQSTLA